MQRVYTIGADTHCAFTELAMLSPGGKLIRRERCPTTIRDLYGILATVRQPRVTVIEEGPLADWLLRGLGERGETVIVCDPRRNHLIAKDSDKDDAIDAEKLGQLYRGGFIKEVHHSESFDRMVFKRRLGLYHDRVRNRVRHANRLMAQCRQLGVFIRERDFASADGWLACQDRLPAHKMIRIDLDLFWDGYTMAAKQVACMRTRVIEMARKEPVVRRFVALPGVAWIRASTFYAYLDTPFRFKKKQSLWRYMGIGLERRVSGEGLERVRVSRDANRILKDMIIGAAMSAIRSKNNPFVDQYGRWLDGGISLRNARRNVARSLATVMWGLWKNGEDYRSDWVDGSTRRELMMRTRTV